MDAIELQKVGLNETQANAYLALLTREAMTPPELARTIDVTRTNGYELASQLHELGLVEKQEVGSKLTYKAKSPSSLKQMLLKEQSTIKERSHHLEGLLPELLSTFRLTNEQPGVLYLEGKSGLETLFDDIIRQQEEVLILPSAHDRDDPEVAAAIDEQIERQIAAGVKVKTIYPQAERLTKQEADQMSVNAIAVRYFGHQLYPAQIMIYGDNVAMSTFRQGVVTTIVTNPQIAGSMRLLFDSMWQAAESAD